MNNSTIMDFIAGGWKEMLGRKEKNVCCQCQQEIPDRHWIEQEAVCVGCYNEIYENKHHYEPD